MQLTEPGNTKKIPFKRALKIILGSTFLVSGSIGIGLLYYFHVRELQYSSDSFNVQSVIQSGEDAGALPTLYLCQLLSLCHENPTNLYQLNEQELRLRLLESPYFKAVEVRKVKPATLEVSYATRKPIARVGDFFNALIDADGVVFPASPFMVYDEDLPEIYFGLSPSFLAWGVKVERPAVELALRLMSRLSAYPAALKVRRIDLSRREVPSFGRKELVALIEMEGGDVLLRLHVDDVEKNLDKLRSVLACREKWHLAPEGALERYGLVVDLRIPQLAYVSWKP